MKDLTPKVDNTGGPEGEYSAAEFNGVHDEAQQVVTGTGQTLTALNGADIRQTMKAIAVGGERVIRADGETCQVGEIVLPQNQSVAVIIHLPAIADLFVNAAVYFEQIADQPFSTHNLTVGRNGQLLMGLAENMVVDDIDNIKFKMTWKAGSLGWVVSTTETVGASSP